MHKKFLLFVLYMTLGACVDKFSVPASGNFKTYVIEGSISNVEEKIDVTIKTTGKYTQDLEGLPRFVSGAAVVIRGSDGSEIPLYENDKPGHYRSVMTASGQIGVSYHVEITLDDGAHIESEPELMLQPVAIDSVYYTYDLSTVREKGFEVFLDMRDPAEARNFYQWKTVSYFPYSELCFHRIETTFPIIAASDKNTNGLPTIKMPLQQVPFNSPFFYVVEVYQSSISEHAYDYLTQIQAQLSSSGSMFDPPPTFIRGNMFDTERNDKIILGYFMVRGVARKDVVINRSLNGLPPVEGIPLYPTPLYCGDPCDSACVTWGHGKCGNPPCPPDCEDLPAIVSKAPASWPLPHNPCPN